MYNSAKIGEEEADSLRRAGHWCMDNARHRCHERNVVRFQTQSFEKSSKSNSGVKSNPHGGAPTPHSPMLPPRSLPFSAFCPPHFDVFCLCPAASPGITLSLLANLLLALSSAASSASWPIRHPRSFISPLPSHTVTLESIQNGLCCTVFAH